MQWIKIKATNFTNKSKTIVIFSTLAKQNKVLDAWIWFRQMKRKLLLVFTYIFIGSIGLAQSVVNAEGAKGVRQTSSFNRSADNDDKKIEVYPNPSTGIVNLTLSGFKGRKTELQVVNVIGSIIYREVLDDNETSRKVLDLTKEPSGLYYIKIQSDDFSEIRKLIVD